MIVGEGYSRSQSKGGANVLTASRRLMGELDVRLAERRSGTDGVGGIEELLSMRREVATIEAMFWPGQDPAGGRRTLAARAVVSEWPGDDPVRAMVLELNELLQRALP